MTRPKAVIIGTGALGLGCLAERLAGHFDLCLADLALNEDLLRRIEAGQSFTVNLCSLEGIYPKTVMGRYRVAFTDTVEGRRKLDQALLEADLVLTATGRRLLDSIVTMIAPAMNSRTRTAWLLFCENGQHIAAAYAASVGTPTVLVDTVISRMCRFEGPHEGRYAPLWPGCDKALVVEDDKFLPLDADRCRSGPFSPAFSLVSHAEFLLWEDIKLYMHNGMHAFVSYHAFLEGATLFADTPTWIRREARRVMLEEVAPAIIHTHDCANQAEIERYGLSLLDRFFNPYLGDTIARGVRGAADKLEPGERLVGGCEFIRRAGIEPRGYETTIQAAKKIAQRQNS